jgi:PPOX class probable F420-dependent enzyme
LRRRWNDPKSFERALLATPADCNATARSRDYMIMTVATDVRAIPPDVRALLEKANIVHLSTLRADGSPRNWPVWVGLEGDSILVCTSDTQRKANDMLRDPRVGLSVVDAHDPYMMASLEGRVVEMRRDEGCRFMDPISIKYTSAPFPSRGPDRVCFVIAVERAWRRKLGLRHRPAER